MLTLKEKIDSFCAKEIVLHVPTKELFIKVCGELGQRGIKWCDDTDANSSPQIWDRHREETLIKLSDYGIRYSNRSWNKNSHIVKITEDDFKPAPKLGQDSLQERTKSDSYDIKCPVPTVGAAVNCRWIYGQNSCACGPALCPLHVKHESPADDSVNHPDGSIEVSDFIADKNLNFFRGNAVKYLCQAGKKDSDKEIEDLKKAEWYLNREIDRLEWVSK